MSCDHFKVGDKGQRFEISVFDKNQGRRIVAAWSDNQEHAARIANGFESRPGWSDAEVLDREQVQ